MDFELSEEQELILGSVRELLGRFAGPARAIELSRSGGYDFELDAALRESGFDRLAEAPDPRPLEAGLVLQEVARAGGISAFSAMAFVVPGATGGAFPYGSKPVALIDAAHPGPIRFAAEAETWLVLEGDRVRCLRANHRRVRPIRSNYGYPMAWVDLTSAEPAESPAIDAERLRAWWRVGLALEAVGAMSGALDQTVGYLKERRQFGRTLASFQAVQHRLADCAIAGEASRWLAYEAAFHGAPGEAAAVAASYAMRSAGQVFSETHQLSGAIGFTHEHDLHVYSMRLQALRMELGGGSRQTRAVSHTRWGMAP